MSFRTISKGIEIRNKIYKLIPNNFYYKNNPYVILVRGAGIQPAYVKLIVYKAKKPFHHPSDIAIATKSRIVWGMSAYFGSTNKSTFHHRLALAIEAREFFNTLHRIERKQQPVTQELLRSVTTPHLKEKLIEAICKAAV